MEIIIAAIIGYLYRDIRDQIKKINLKLDKKEEIGVTPGTYGKINEVANQGGVGVFTPKTPAQLDWEEAERLREEQLNVKVK